MYNDKEYAILEFLSENETVAQRRISKLLDISLGSVNMLINKMQKDGLIKIKNISAKSVAYMLTPEGITEKANKTYKYVTFHYKRINETKEKIKTYLENKIKIEEKIHLVLDDSEMSEIISLALHELENRENIEVISANHKINNIENECLYILIKNEDKENYEGLRIEILLEML